MDRFPESLHLRSELKEIVLGYYDFERFLVPVGAHDDPNLIPVTLMHEAHHQRLNLHSTFGLLVNRVAEQARSQQDPQLASRYEDLLGLLLKECTFVHEMFATYASLVEFERTDLLSTMPSEYQECYRAMDSALRYVPLRKQWRLASAWHLARMAMFAKPYPILTNVGVADIDKIAAQVTNSAQMSPNRRMKLLHDAMQEFDIDAFQQRLEEAGAPIDQLDAYLAYDEPHEIARALGQSVQSWPGIHDNWNFFVMHGFLDQFEELLPGLEDSRGDVSAIRAAQLAAGMVGRDRMGLRREASYGLKEHENLVELCNQQVTFYHPEMRITPAIIPPEQAPGSFVDLNLYRFLQTTYLLYLVPHPESDPAGGSEIHVIDAVQQGRVPHIVIQGEDAVDLFILAGSMISIVEIVGDQRVWDASFLRYLAGIQYLGKPFLFQRGNPILMIEQLLYLGCQVDWCPLVVAYQRGPVNEQAGLHICLYWTNALPFPIFHFSNAGMTAAIEVFCSEYIANASRFRRIENENILQWISREDFSKFVDHPVFSYYLRGTTAAESLALARGK